MSDLNDGVLKGIVLFNQDGTYESALRKEVEDSRVCLAAARKLRKQHEKEIRKLTLERDYNFELFQHALLEKTFSIAKRRVHDQYDKVNALGKELEKLSR